MSGTTHATEARCPDCGHDEARVRVRGNAFSAVCTSCGRADVRPVLTGRDLLDVEGERFDAELFELDAARYGSACALTAEQLPDTDSLMTDELGLRVELRLPVPPR